MGQPQRIGDLLRVDLDTMFTTLNPELAAKCRAEFTKGYQYAVAVLNGQVKNLSSKPSTTGDSQRARSSALTRTTPIGDTSPLVAMATLDEACKAVFDVAYVFGHQLHKDAIKAMAEVILNGKWTKSELELAAAYIPTDFEMCQTITYNRTINPTVFAKVRSVPSVMRGRLFGHSEAIDFSASQDRPLHEVFEPVRRGEQTMFLMR